MILLWKILLFLLLLFFFEWYNFTTDVLLSDSFYSLSKIHEASQDKIVSIVSPSCFTNTRLHTMFSFSLPLSLSLTDSLSFSYKRMRTSKRWKNVSQVALVFSCPFFFFVTPSRRLACAKISNSISSGVPGIFSRFLTKYERASGWRLEG